MNIGMEDACNTYLGLGLGQYDPSIKLNPSSTSSRLSPKLLEPSLTLGLSDGRRRPSSPRSPNSSFSSANLSKVKRETDSVTEEAERVSSRTSDEEEEGSARKKLRLTKEQSALLEGKFKEHATLNPKQKQALAKQLNLRPRQVEVWFQNRRARTKLKQTEVDCEVLKKYCETLSNENRRLKKELDELKALKVAPRQMYMQIPALPTVTVCPSCEKVAGASDGQPFMVTPKAQFLSPFARSTAC